MSMPVPAPAYRAACTGCGQPYADEESGVYLFVSPERMERCLRADGWRAFPVVCPACQPDDDPAPDGIPGQMPFPGVA